MTNESKKRINLDSKEELDGFARFLGVEYEDLYELGHLKNFKDDIDFDDYSR